MSRLGENDLHFVAEYPWHVSLFFASNQHETFTAQIMNAKLENLGLEKCPTAISCSFAIQKVFIET